MTGKRPRRGLRDWLIGVACRLLALLFRPLLRTRRVASGVGRVVIVKPGSLGDVLMATATVRALRASLPKSHLAFAVGAWSRPALEGNPHLDAIIDLPLHGRRNGFKAYSRAVRLLRSGRYDAALVLDRSPLMTILPFLARIPVRIGLDSDGRGFSLTTRVVCPDGRHEVELYLDVVRAVGLDVLEPATQFFPSADDRRIADGLLSDALAAWPARNDSPLVAIHAGGGVNPGMRFPAKRWPPGRFAALADRLYLELGATVLLIGGPDDQELTRELVAAQREPSVDLTGKLSWGQLAALLQRCRLLVANDTGTAHLAGAVATPVVVLFGPTDPAQYGPYGGRGEAVYGDLPCRPCFSHGRFPDCPYGHRCMTELELDLVWAAVNRQWRRGKARVCTHSGEEGGRG